MQDMIKQICGALQIPEEIFVKAVLQVIEEKAEQDAIQEIEIHNGAMDSCYDSYGGAE